MRPVISILLCFLLYGCVGIDYLDDPVIGESIVVSPNPIAVIVDKVYQATYVFKDQYGLAKEVSPIWSTSNPEIATVDNKGLVTGKKQGQTFLKVAYSVAKDSVLVTVVASSNAVAKVEIVESMKILTIGQSVTLTATIKNINDQAISGKTINWQSNNDLVISINSDGVATAKSNGTASVVAVVDGVSSNPVNIVVGNMIKVGMFVRSSGGYEAAGSCKLSTENNMLILKFESDFKTSFALGTFVYLSNNNTNASTVKAAGLELGQITQNGIQSFNITALNPTVKIDDYKYVIILCKPATVIFGYAELK